jgi:cytochrome c biogenesis protein CcdA
MIRLIGIMISIGLADSINPTTIAPGLYLASEKGNARVSVSEFTLGVFLVYLIGGLIIALGPGELVINLVPKPDRNTRQILEVIAGGVLIGASFLLWKFRSTLRTRELPVGRAEGRRSSLWLGVTITAVELPTAFPYFGAIAAVVGSGQNIGSQVLLIALYNFCFILPLLGIIAILYRYGDEAERVLGRVRHWLQAHWPVLLAVVALAAGGIVIALGVTGLASRSHGRLGQLARQFQQVIH